MADLSRAEQMTRDAKLGRELVEILSHHCGERGESEGAAETLIRIIRERDGGVPPPLAD